MRYLVTGGFGVVGSVIARRLLASGHSVTVLDACEATRNRWIRDRLKIFELQHPPESRLTAGEWRIEQLAPSEIAKKVLSQVDAVIHCAASTGIPHSVLNPDDDWLSNVDATRTLLEALRAHPLPTVVLSSVKPYKVQPGVAGITPSFCGLTENDVLEPDEPYAASKAAQSMLTMAYARSYNIPAVTFRCSNLYGPAPCHGPRHGWLTWFAISAAIGRPIEVQGTGTQTRDMLHADDVHSACMAALESADRLKGMVFNIGGGYNNRISVGEAAAELVAMAGDGSISTAPARAMDDDHVFANYGAFLKATGWRPMVGVRDGMRQVFEWARENKEELTKLYEGV